MAACPARFETQTGPWPVPGHRLLYWVPVAVRQRAPNVAARSKHLLSQLLWRRGPTKPGPPRRLGACPPPPTPAPATLTGVSSSRHGPGPTSAFFSSERQVAGHLAAAVDTHFSPQHRGTERGTDARA